MPSIAAFGGTNFDMTGAFASLYLAATVPTPNDLSREGCNVACPGQRPSLDKWLSIHYIPTQSNAWGGAGETLEDVTADFALAQFARRLGRGAEAAELLARSGYWRNIFNPRPRPISATSRTATKTARGRASIPRRATASRKAAAPSTPG